ncbi:MAG: 50S ribosome-binding GTPase [Firmicutes bacterium]|nr:50S ribosome-binding GTPase [Bacillota bacterium]
MTNSKIEQAILNAQDLTEHEKNKMLALLAKNRDNKANILITGATGAGKSSTINAMFNMEVATVGLGVDAETTELAKFELGNLTLWDSPGLGNSPQEDRQNSENIIDLLNEEDDDGNFLIDVVLVVLDGTSKDLSLSYQLINEIIIPNLHETERLLIGINKADAMLNGRHWDYQNGQPLPPLQNRIHEKVKSVSSHIYNATSVSVEPLAYSAGYKEENCPQEKPYNLAKLLCFLLDKIPEEKRATVAENASESSWGDYSIGDILGMGALLLGGVFVAVLDGIETTFDNISDLFDF